MDSRNGTKNPGPLLTSVTHGVLELVPRKWLGKLKIRTTKQKNPLTQTVDELAGTRVASSLAQDQTNERLKTNVDLESPIGKQLLEYVRTKDGQVATRILKYIPEGTPLPTFDELTIDAGQEASGNGYSEQVFVTTPNLFGANDYSVELRDVIPPEFVALLKTYETAETVAGTAVMPTLVTGDLRRSETQLTEQTKRITRRYRDISVAPVIIDKDTNREKQVVTIRKTLVLDTATPLLPTAIKDTKFDVLGNGLAVQTEISIDAVFVGAVYEKSILNLIPERFRADVPQRKHDFTVQNSAVSVNPPLATGDLTRRETQIDEFNKRVEISSIDTTEIPKTVTDKGLTREFGGSETTIWFTLDVTGSQVIETGKRVIDSKIQRLGNGYEVLVTERAVDTDWAELSGQDYDERFDVILPFTQQVKTAGVDLGTPRTEIKPLDKWRQQNRTVDIEAIQDFLDDYLLEYAGRTNVDLPDKLVGISAVMVSDQGEGTSEETGDIAFTGNYSISMALRATAQSSLNKIPEVMTDIKQFWGNNIPCLNYQFFLPSPVTAADILTKITAITGGVVTTWPKYNPEMVSLVIRGGRVSVQVSASSQGSDAVNDSGTSSTTGGGTGYSREVGLSVKSMRISPTIHGEIVISGTTTASGTVSATATAEATGLGPFETETQTGDASASITPTTIPATAGDVSWPDSGKFLYRVDAQPYRFGYIQVHAIVVDTADFPTSP